jgi:hypothetical protein
MTGNDEQVSVQAIELCRGIQRRAAEQCVLRGITLEDVAVASLYATFDTAARFRGDTFGAIEWLRTGLDLMERQLLAEAKAE